MSNTPEHGQMTTVLSALIDASTGIDQVIEDMSTLGAAEISDLGAETGRDYGHEPLALAVREFADA